MTTHSKWTVDGDIYMPNTEFDSYEQALLELKKHNDIGSITIDFTDNTVNVSLIWVINE